MKIYFFVSRLEPKVTAFTSDQTGANLPLDYAPWDRSGAGSAIPIGGDDGPITVAVRRDGYFLVSGRGSFCSGGSVH
jgi:hypothetical protein